MNDIHSLAHLKWNCKYHIVFAPKYRRKVFYGQKRLDIGAILRELCKWKEVNILEFLKGKSSLLIYEKWANMKYKYRSREFWSKGYYVDTVGKNTERIKEYIQNQLEEDRTVEQLCIAEAFDPFEKHGK